MNSKLRRRLIAVSGIIIAVVILVSAFIGSANSAKSVTVEQAADTDLVGKKVQVSGNVVKNSFHTEGDSLVFDIYNPEGDAQKHITISYPAGVPSTFGNDVTAICTGIIKDDGILYATELVTKCPSKYESATDALTISRLFEYGQSVLDKPLKITGVVKDSTLQAAGKGDRFVLADSASGEEIAVTYDGALSEEVKDGCTLVVTGSINNNGKFIATDVALEV